MKITRLEIKDFQQFKDFTLDLTYPKGHELEGKPLKKVCFIGQSGTGKTTLLNILKDLNYQSDKRTFVNDYFILNTEYKIEYIWKDIYHEYSRKYQENGGIHFEHKPIKPPYVKDIIFGSPPHSLGRVYHIFIPAEMLDMINNLFETKLKNPFQNITTTKEIQKNVTEEREKLLRKFTFDFKNDDVREIWKAILFDQSEYEDERAKYSYKISEALLEDDEMGITELKEKFKKWKNENPNPLGQLAESLNPYLNKFHLEINPKTEYRRSDEVKFIEIQSTNGTNISFKNWSTGTKQIILTATPLFKLNTEETVILFDEPERSLYPDLQREIIDYYTGLASDAQFFFATHSPLIASSFEPWEIVELKFDDNGNVYRETDKYYEGEYHVDNFKFDPRYLRWDEILTDLYNLEEDGQDERIDELVTAVGLKKKIEKMRKDGKIETEEFKKVFETYIKSARKLGWNL